MVYFRRSIRRREPVGAAQHPGWPEATNRVRLSDGSEVYLRPLLFADFRAWQAIRMGDRALLEPVEPTLQDWDGSHSWTGFSRYFHSLRSQALQGEAVPMAIVVDGAFAGQMTVSEMEVGHQGWVGYYVGSRFQGRGVATAATALMVDHMFARTGVHRLAATYLPSNPASGKVLSACGFKQEGLLRSYLHIAGQWEDHYVVGLVRDDYLTGAVQRLMQAGRVRAVGAPPRGSSPGPIP